MTYDSDWPLATPADLPELVKHYVRNTLLKDAGVSLLTWDRSGPRYAQTAEMISGMFGSMVADAGFSLSIPQTMVTSDQKRAYIRNRMKANSTQSDIRRVYRKARQAARDTKKRVFVVFLRSFWYRQGRAVGHAQFIVIDYRRSTQVFFDPHGRTILQSDLNFFQELCLVDPIISTHENIPPQQGLGIGLQSHMERSLDREQCGTCGLTSLITLLCARRYNYWHFPRLSEAIQLAFPTFVDAAVVIQGLVDVYESRVLQLNIRSSNITLDQEKQLFQSLFPPDDRCKVYSDSSGRFCSRKACKNGDVLSLCWQHRFYLQNPYNTSKKCAASFR